MADEQGAIPDTIGFYDFAADRLTDTGEVDTTGWRVNPHTPSVIMTPHGRISIGWSIQHEGEANDYSLAEAAASLIVSAVTALATPKPPADAGAMREALNRIADLGSCAGGKAPAHKLFQQAIDIATGAL